MGPEALGAQRTTVRFLENGTVDCQADDWRGKTKTDDNVKWRGYTFVKLQRVNLCAWNYKRSLMEAMNPSLRDVNEEKALSAISARGSFYGVTCTEGF